MKYALIINGIVDTVSYDPTPDWIEVDNTVFAGFIQNGASFTTPPVAIDLTAYAANKRFEVETGGITVSGAMVATDRDSQNMISNAAAYVAASGATSVSFKAPAGFITLGAATLKAIALAIGAHVQSCFATEATIDAGVASGTITTTAQIDAAFAG